MTLTISDREITFAADGTPQPTRGTSAHVVAQPTIVPLWVRTGSSTEQEEDQSAVRTATVSATDGTWSLVLPWPSRCTPNTVQFTIKRSDGAVFIGTVPEGVSGPLTIWDLTTTYGWGLVTAGVVLPPATAIPAQDATTSAIGCVLIDQAPPSGHPVALTSPRVGAASGLAALDANSHVVQQAVRDATEAQTDDTLGSTSTITNNLNRIRCQIGQIVGGAWTAAVQMIPLAQKAAPSGVCDLDSATHVPLARLAGLTSSQLSSSAAIAGSQLSSSAAIAGSQLSSSAGLSAAQISSVNPSALTGSGTVPPAGLPLATVGTAGAQRRSALDVRDYGAMGDARSVATGAITASSAVLIATGAGFAANDVGKYVSVAGAGASGAVLETTIASYQSATQVTLAASASTTASGAAVFWGTDDTAAIQAALSAASAYVGATTGAQWQNTNTTPGTVCVLAPPTAGGYLCTGVLSVPRGVKLRGGEAAASPLDTTLLLTTQGRGNAAGTPFITLHGTGGLEGIALFYPNQVHTSAVVAYPWAISTAAGQDNFLRNCMLVNPFKGVSFTGGRFFVSGLFGQPLRTGIFVDGPADACHMDHVQFTPQWWIDGIGSGGVEDYMLANLTAFSINRVDVLSMSNCVVYRAQYGLVLGDTGQGGAWITASNVALDGCKIALNVSNAQNLGCEFDNCIFNATDGFNQSAVYIGGGDNYLCAISNSRLVSNNGNTVHVDPGATGAAVLALSGCRIGQTVSNKEDNAVYAGSATTAVRLYGCEFWSAPSAYHVNLGGITTTQTAAPQVLGCTFVSPRRVNNPGNKTLIENGNTDNLSLLGASALAQAPVATSNYGLVSVGAGGFAGPGGANFSGHPSGTIWAANVQSGFGGSFIDLQKAGVSQISLANDGTSYFGGLRCHGTDTANTLYQTNAGDLGVGTAGGDINLHPTGKVGIGVNSGPTSLLYVNGPIGTAQATKTATHTLGAADSTILVNAASTTMTLPDATACAGRVYSIKNDSSGSNTTVATTSAQTIDGAATYALTAAWNAVTVQSNGAGWRVIGKV